MNTFSRRYLEGLEEVDGFILKAKSPSCAITDAKIFSSTAAGDHATLGPGLFAGAALEAFGSRAFVDETGLNDAGKSARVSSPESSPSPPSVKPGDQAAAERNSPATTRRTSSCSWPITRRPCARWGESRRIMINTPSAKSSPAIRKRALAAPRPHAGSSLMGERTLPRLGASIRKKSAEKRQGVAFSIFSKNTARGELPLDGPLATLEGLDDALRLRIPGEADDFRALSGGVGWGVIGNTIKVLPRGRYNAPTVWSIQDYERQNRRKYSLLH